MAHDPPRPVFPLPAVRLDLAHGRGSRRGQQRTAVIRAAEQLANAAVSALNDLSAGGAAVVTPVLPFTCAAAGGERGNGEDGAVRTHINHGCQRQSTVNVNLFAGSNDQQQSQQQKSQQQCHSLGNCRLPDFGRLSSVRLITAQQARALSVVWHSALRIARRRPAFLSAGPRGGSSRPQTRTHTASMPVTGSAREAEAFLYAARQRAVPFVAMDVSLPAEAGTVRLTDILPSADAARLEDPSQMLRGERDPPPPRLPRGGPRLYGSQEEYTALVRRIWPKGMVDFTETPIAVNGVFCVPKDGGALRLIIDARWANAHFKDPEKVRLPTPETIASLRLSDREVLFVAKADIDNCYHRMVLPEWVRPYFALPPVRAGDIGPDVAARFGADAKVYPMCVTLPMGWSHSVVLAQKAHEHLIDTHPEIGLSRERRMLGTEPKPVGPFVWYAVYIDDLNLFGTDPKALSGALERYIGVMERHGMRVKQTKVVRPTADGVDVLGLQVHGREHSVALSVPKLDSLWSETAALLRRGRCSGAELSALVGKWTWAALVNRPVLSVLSSVYRFVEAAEWRTFTVWRSVREELIRIAALAPVMVARLSMPVAPITIATDASEWGVGVAVTSVPLPVSAGRPPVGVVGSESDMQSVSTQSPTTGSRLEDAVVLARWREVISAQWRKGGEHINSLELRAVHTGIKWAFSSPQSFASRMAVVTDSAVTFWSVRKGRASSPALLRRLRQIAAALLAFGAALDVGWVRSEVNPADGASRRFQDKSVGF